MRIGISPNMRPNGYDRWGDRQYHKLKSHGFDCVDYSMAEPPMEIYTRPESEAMGAVIYEKRLADAAGVTFSQVHGPVICGESTPEQRRAHLERMKRAVRLTALLECPYMVIHPVTPFGYDLENGMAPETWRINKQLTLELLEEANKHAVVICMKNLPYRGFSLSTPDRILEFVREVDDPNFGACLDTGHAALFDSISVDESVCLLGKHLKLLHVHDNDGKEDWHRYPGAGVIDWLSFSKALREISYEGVLSLETIPDTHLPDDIFEMECLNLNGIARALTLQRN